VGGGETRGELMNEARSAKLIQAGKPLLAGLLLIIVAVAFGLFLGNLMISPDWQDAVRLVFMGSLIVAILMSPIHGLLLWMIIAPFAQASHTEIWRILNIRMPPGIPDLTPDRLAAGLLCVVFVAQLAIGKKRVRRLGPEVFMAVFGVMVLPAAAASLSGLSSAGQLALDKFIIPFLLFALAKNLYQEKIGVERVSAGLAVIGIYLSLMILYEHLTGQPLFTAIGRTTVYSRSLRKIVSLLGNPAFLGTVLGMIAPIALFRYVRERSVYVKAFYGALFVTTLLGNFFCYNRGAWLALAAGLMVLLFERKYRRILLPIVLVGALVGLLYWQTISASAVVTERLSNVSSIQFRLDLLAVSQKLIRDHLLFGVGVGNFAYYFLQYGGHWETLAYDLPTPHNTYVLVLSTMGLVAFVPYLLVFLSMFLQMVAMLRRSKEDGRVDRALLVSGVAVIAVYMVSAAAVDLYASVFSSLVFFLITGTILGYVGHLRSSWPRLQRAQAVRAAERHASSPAERDASGPTMMGV
jgi:O-antigen ligase